MKIITIVVLYLLSIIFSLRYLGDKCNGEAIHGYCSDLPKGTKCSDYYEYMYSDGYKIMFQCKYFISKCIGERIGCDARKLKFDN